MNQTECFEKAIEFIREIGIEIAFKPLEKEQCFLPGLNIDKGCILIDRENLEFPGDILHEAAHIALMPASERSHVNGEDIGKRKDAAAEEMATIAWTYAACLHLNIDPSFVFHEHGYKGAASSIADNFKEGKYFGAPILKWFGMTGSGGYNYPAMIKWKRD